MTSTTTNLGLTVYNNTTDQSGSFLSWQRDMSGSANSNMIKIDNWSGSASGSITNMNANISASLTFLSGSVANVSGSLATIISDITTLGFKFNKIAEFEGAGQADFDNISGSYTHLLVIGVASGNYAGTSVDIGFDFNGDANSSNYTAFQWQKNNPLETITAYTIGGITVANVPGNAAANYGGPFLAIIPNYSSSTGLYKTAMGISARYSLTDYAAAISGGTWKSTDAITRLRVTANLGNSTRYSFVSGTKITLYGLG